MVKDRLLLGIVYILVMVIVIVIMLVINGGLFPPTHCCFVTL